MKTLLLLLTMTACGDYDRTQYVPAPPPVIVHSDSNTSTTYIRETTTDTRVEGNKGHHRTRSREHGQRRRNHPQRRQHVQPQQPQQQCQIQRQWVDCNRDGRQQINEINQWARCVGGRVIRQATAWCQMGHNQHRRY